ncbi:YdiY family protein [Psychromonas sp. 14N.309.X.WAT.B.A12]|uniref:DUF481 domain-containing protein n=1 Tax=unclassified Psychromonas TaxID=2614957 RepID=UPI0025B01ACA|nr:DUF481 domain-containing protein [Psychromonas sp. 14N.309.X.WAT.B.A12]MDN2664004.1 DUF481 domain-containing protein [Psychromonas sp. 14N.309.X.WAT.B.A12]
MKKILFTTAIALALPLSAYAADEKSEFVEGDATIGGEAELGATVTTGNTDTSSFKAALEIKQELSDWENTYSFDGTYKKDEDEVTAKRYYFEVQGDYQIDDLSYLFANTNYEIDPFSGYDYSSSTSAGYGYRFIDTKRMSLTAEAGPGYVYQKYDDDSAETEGEDYDASAVAHIVVDFQTKIGDSAKFQQKFVADWGSKLDGRSETSISANLVGSLAMKFAVVVRYDNKPLEDVKSTDTETTMTLLYGF